MAEGKKTSEAEESINEMPNNPLEHDKYIPENFNVLGKRGIRRIDGYKKASGRAIYTRDILLPGMLYAKILTCPYPNAKIRHMDTSRAEALPGVRAILRYDDPEVKDRRVVSSVGQEAGILDGFAYFEGQQVGAAVAADTEDIADEALKLIDVDWEERPFILDHEEAVKPEAVLSRPELMPENNLTTSLAPFPRDPSFKLGDVEQGFGEADKVIEFKASRRYHGCPDVECPNGITRWDGEGVELWLHHQHPYEHKWLMHKWFDIPMNKIKINSPYISVYFC